MSDEEVRLFLAQFDKARENIKTWPQWMQDAAHEAAATFPRPPRPLIKGQTELNRFTAGVEEYRRSGAAKESEPVRLEVGKSYLTRCGATVSIHTLNQGNVFIGSFGPGNERVQYIKDGRYVGPGFVQRGELRDEPWDVVQTTPMGTPKC